MSAMRRCVLVLLALVVSQCCFARDYEAATGRYIESDPIGLRGGLSTYSYVGQSPLILSDESGLQTPVLCSNPVNAAACAAAGEPTVPTVIGGAEAAVVGGVAGGIAGDQMAAPGNVGDTQIESDFGQAVSEAKAKDCPPPERCAWLLAQAAAGKYSADRIKRQEKKWGCRRSRSGR